MQRMGLRSALRQRRLWDLVSTAQRGIMATPCPALLRSRGRPSPLHGVQRKGSALPTGPTERGVPPPLLGLSPGLCGPGGGLSP